MSISVSTNDPQATPPPPAENPPASRAQGRVVSSPWVWMTLACVLLGASGGVRAWQDHRFATVQDDVAVSPFPLKDLPQTLGDWRAQEGSDTSLDPEVARIAGSSDHVIRTYTNATTGQSLTVLILFGPAQFVYGHQPAVCYPAAGYRPVAETLTRSVPNGSGPPAAVLLAGVCQAKRSAAGEAGSLFFVPPRQPVVSRSGTLLERLPAPSLDVQGPDPTTRDRIRIVHGTA